MEQNLLHTLKDYFTRQPVLKVWLFGSMSRDEDTPNSDDDLLVRFDPKAKVSLFKHIAMIAELESLMNRDVDLVTDGTLFPWIEETVNSEKILMYERETA